MPMNVFKLLLKTILIISLLINSAGQGYLSRAQSRDALRPIAAWNVKDIEVKASSAGTKNSPGKNSSHQAVVIDLKGNPIDTCSANRILPERVTDSISQGKVSKIEGLYVDRKNILILSKGVAYDFTKYGEHGNRPVTVYFNGLKEAQYFTILKDNGELLAIFADEVRIELSPIPKAAIVDEKEKDGLFRFDAVALEKDITPAEQDEIRKAISAAILELPIPKRPTAIMVLQSMAGLKKAKDVTVVEQISKHTGISQRDVKEILMLLIKTAALRRLAKDYRPELLLSTYEPEVSLRFDGPPPPALKSGFVYLRNLDTGELRTVTKNELVILCKKKKIDNVEVIYDRLSTRGLLLLGTDKDGRENAIAKFKKYKGRKIRYIIRKGKVDRSTIVVLNDRNRPLIGPNERYAVDPKTGEIRCHLPGYVQKALIKLLDDVIIFDRLDSKGALHFGTKKSGGSIRVCQFTNYAHQGVRYRHIHNYKVDRTTITLLNEDSTPLMDNKLRYAADPETDKIRCHIPEQASKELRAQLNRLEDIIIYGRLGKTSTLHGWHGQKPTPIAKFRAISGKQHSSRRAKYHLRKGRPDKTSILLLNEDGTIFEDTWIRYAVDPKTGKIKCHLPEMVHKPLRKQLNNLLIFDRLSKRGHLSLSGKVVAVFSKQPFRRVKYYIRDGKIDTTTVLLLKEDGTVLEDDNINYVVDTKTNEIRCHLPMEIFPELRRKLEGYIVYDRLYKTGQTRLGATRYTTHPKRRARYRFYNANIAISTIILLDEAGHSLQDGKTRYAVDLETEEIKFYLPKKVVRRWIPLLNNIEIMNGRLNSAGNLQLVAEKPIYRNMDHKNGRIRYLIYKNKVVAVTLLDEDYTILAEEIIDNELALELFSGKGIIEGIKGLGESRIITYSKFLERLLNDYTDSKARQIHPYVIRTMLQKRLYDLLRMNVYFFFGENLNISKQFELKTKIFLLWKDMERIPEEDIRERLLELVQYFARQAGGVMGSEPADASQVPAKLYNQIMNYQNEIIRSGKLHKNNTDLPKPEGLTKGPAWQIVNSAA